MPRESRRQPYRAGVDLSSSRGIIRRAEVSDVGGEKGLDIAHFRAGRAVWSHGILDLSKSPSRSVPDY